VIVDAAEATRLAHALVSDAVLYGGGDEALKQEGTVRELRTLFHARVSPDLHRVLEESIAARGGLDDLRTVVARDGRDGAATAPPSTSRVQVEDGAGILRIALPVVIALAVLAIGALLAFMR
jgi:hypothetical protein